jgi:hypothetical protein
MTPVHTRRRTVATRVCARDDLDMVGPGAGEYSPMLTEADTIRLDLPAAPTTDVVRAILEALAHLEARFGLGTNAT